MLMIWLGVHTESNRNGRFWLTYETTQTTQSEGVGSDDLHYVEGSPQRDAFDSKTGWRKGFPLFSSKSQRRSVFFARLP